MSKATEIRSLRSPGGRLLCSIALLAAPAYRLARDVLDRRARHEQATEDRLREILAPVRDAALREDAEVAALDELYYAPAYGETS